MMVWRLNFELITLGLLTLVLGRGAVDFDQVAAQTATPALTPSQQGIEEIARIPLPGGFPSGSIDVVLQRTQFTQSDYVTFDTYAGPHLVYAEHGMIRITMYEPDQDVLCRPGQHVLIPTGQDYSVLTMENGAAAALTFAMFGDGFPTPGPSETDAIRCSGVPAALNYRALTAPTPTVYQMAVTPTVPPFGPEPEELDWQRIDSQGLSAAEVIVAEIDPELWPAGAEQTGSALPPCGGAAPGTSAAKPGGADANDKLCLNGVVALVASSQAGDGLDHLLAFGVSAPGQPLLLVA